MFGVPTYTRNNRRKELLCGLRSKDGERMTQFIILSKVDIATLCKDAPVTVYIENKPYIICTDEYFEKDMRGEKDD